MEAATFSLPLHNVCSPSKGQSRISSILTFNRVQLRSSRSLITKCCNDSHKFSQNRLEFSVPEVSHSPLPSLRKHASRQNYGLKSLGKGVAIFLLTGAAIFFCNFRLSRNPFPLPLALAGPSSFFSFPFPNKGGNGGKRQKTYSEEELEEMAEEYLKRKPNDLTAQKILLRAKLKDRDFKGAIDLLDKLSKAEPFESLWLLLKGDCSLYCGDFEGARKIYKRILQSMPYHRDAIRGLATVMEKCNEESAILPMLEDILQRALSEHDEVGVKSLRLLIGKYYMLEKRYQEALKNYQDIAEKDPEDFVPYFWQGIIYDAFLNKEEDALKQFQKCDQLMSKDIADGIDMDELFAILKVQFNESKIGRDTNGILLREAMSDSFIDPSIKLSESKGYSDSGVDKTFTSEIMAESHKVDVKNGTLQHDFIATETNETLPHEHEDTENIDNTQNKISEDVPHKHEESENVDDTQNKIPEDVPHEHKETENADNTQNKISEDVPHKHEESENVDDTQNKIPEDVPHEHKETENADNTQNKISEDSQGDDLLVATDGYLQEKKEENKAVLPDDEELKSTDNCCQKHDSSTEPPGGSN
eukprot:TRINITY_DN33036_c0_g1_i1.p1 TRINITY_DN33036_c0_g1~~TRINITY_DN33036_c0_g1_i1.p1  ORF type:complete len:588 (+),score=123.89 TRINITY_DN33036_c0_g1_i1:148-1911(+)